MSADKEAEPKPKKKSGLLMKLMLPVVLLGVGGGGAYGLIAAGVIGGGGHKAEKEDNRPKLIRKGEEDPYAPKAEGGKEGEGGGAADVDGEGGSKSPPAYSPSAEDSPPTHKNPAALLQVSLACPPRRDGRVLMWVKKHELAIRSAMLQVIADTPEEDLMSLEGKDRLQKRLAGAINKVLTDTEGFGGIDAVYFRSFIVQ